MIIPPSPIFPPTPQALPKQVGVGFKPEHFRDIVDTKPHLGFFEVHAENYMVAGGIFHHYLETLRADYALSIHGVGLSLGGEAPLDLAHLQRLKTLIDRYQPESFSEHLAWSTHQQTFLNDLLPIPYTLESLQRVCAHVAQTQEVLQRRILIENPSTYLEFAQSTFAETDFIIEILRRTGCGLLLDVNNVYVSCMNHGRSAKAYLNALPLADANVVGEIHLAGFSEDQDAAGDPLLIDHHGSPVADAVWALYDYTLSRTGAVATLLERDNHIPAFATLLEEAQVAQGLLTKALNAPTHGALMVA